MQTKTCPICGEVLVWKRCDDCHGTGKHVFDGYQEPCSSCGGERGWWECPALDTAPQHTRRRQRRAHLRALLTGGGHGRS